ncbi:MAG TPA: hypothetical protein VKP58_11205 [Candidatus Acidoferrum sp.]|nr:hypothetical protein [Candidatus Acidoferrum sp.]
MNSRCIRFSALALCAAAVFVAGAAPGRAQSAPKTKNLWKSVPFAIVRYNDDAPKSWNLYYSGKRGVLLLRLWKRYLLIDRNQQLVFDIDPEKVKEKGDDVEFLAEANTGDPADITDWRERDVGQLRRLRFRFGAKGNYLDIQTPLKANGEPLY